MTMGRQSITDKTIRPLTTITNITPAGVIPDASRAGVIPVGNYKGVPAFWDLDKAVNQPLVLTEQLHILGILDGREVAYDLINVTIPAASVPGTVGNGAITVPTGAVAYINAVQLFIAVPDAVAGFTLNWHCNLWTDRAAVPSAFGQPFRTAAAALVATNCPAAFAPPPWVANDEFGDAVPILALTNKQPLLRVPGGNTITLTVLTNTGNVAVATICSLALFGFIGRPLVA